MRDPLSDRNILMGSTGEMRDPLSDRNILMGSTGEMRDPLSDRNILMGSTQTKVGSQRGRFIVNCILSKTNTCS
jgi:hypothetical protein